MEIIKVCLEFVEKGMRIRRKKNKRFIFIEIKYLNVFLNLKI